LIIGQARHQTGHSRRDPARRPRTAQSVVARIELGTTSPSMNTVASLLRAAGFELATELRPKLMLDRQLLDDMPRILRLGPDDRLRDDANLVRLAAALRALDARVYTESVPEGFLFDATATMLTRADVWNLVTLARRLNIAFEPSGTTEYDDLARNAEHFMLFGSDVAVARLEDIARSKEAADRPKDRHDVLLMRAMVASSRRGRSRRKRAPGSNA
jgi:hypothetical protein